MSTFASRIQIIKVEQTPSKKLDPATNQPFVNTAARCILFNDDNTVNTVGRLRVPKVLVPKAKEGVFRATFGLMVRDFGDNKGDVIAELTDLTEEPRGTRKGEQAQAGA